MDCQQSSNKPFSGNLVSRGVTNTFPVAALDNNAMVFLRTPNAEPKKGIRSYKAIALTSAIFNGATCVI